MQQQSIIGDFWRYRRLMGVSAVAWGEWAEREAKTATFGAHFTWNMNLPRTTQLRGMRRLIGKVMFETALMREGWTGCQRVWKIDTALYCSRVAPWSRQVTVWSVLGGGW